MLNAFKKAFAVYEDKMNKLAIALENQADSLHQVAAECNQVSQEYQTLADSLRDIAQ